MPDLKTNTLLESGLVKCHSRLDLEITPYGDIALTKSEEERFMQCFMIYWGIPPGERIDPRIGCPWFDYQHAKSTDANLQSFERDLELSLKWHFPELGVRSLHLEYLDSHTIYGVLTMSADELRFIIDEREMMDLENNIWDPFRDLLTA